MNRVASRISGAVFLYSLVHAVVNGVWLAKRGGSRSALEAGILGVGLPAVAEVWITSLDKFLTHRMSPKILGVPLAIPLLWFNVIFGSLATVEASLRRFGLSDRERQIVLAPATAFTATSMDFVLDCFGLDRGLWEWKLGGPYARDVEGANGVRGIPILNFLGWLTLVWSVVHLHRKLSPKPEEDASSADVKRFRKLAVLALVPYYLVSIGWAIRNRKLRLLLYSAAFPALAILALRSSD